MNAELKAKWIAALRSGEYEQGRSQLRRRDQFCCLGVLCDVSGLGEWVGRDFDYGDGRSACFHLPDELLALLGLRYQGEFVRMNDIEKKSFAEIADYIEAHL